VARAIDQPQSAWRTLCEQLWRGFFPLEVDRGDGHPGSTIAIDIHRSCLVLAIHPPSLPQLESGDHFAPGPSAERALGSRAFAIRR
jgi:hypothetical protein